jgi:hypothetical protein
LYHRLLAIQASSGGITIKGLLACTFKLHFDLFLLVIADHSQCNRVAHLMLFKYRQQIVRRVNWCMVRNHNEIA